MRNLIIYLFLLISVNVFSQFTTMFNDTLRPFGSGGDGFDNVIIDSNVYFVLGYIYIMVPIQHLILLR